MTTAGFPHSETLGSQPGCRLPEDYRRLQRPSSAPGTKTSTVCPYKLDTRHYMQFCRLQKMLASTMQFSRYGRNHASRPPIRKVSTAGRSSQRPGKSGCFLRTQQCARKSLPRQALVPQLPRGEERTNRVALAKKPNSQCSTRKHGRPGERLPPEDAGAP
jgi:hypothetical protein